MLLCPPRSPPLVTFALPLAPSSVWLITAPSDRLSARSTPAARSWPGFTASQLRQSGALFRVKSSCPQSGCSKARMRWSFKAYLDDSFFGLDIQFHYILYSPTSADAPASHASCTSELPARRLVRSTSRRLPMMGARPRAPTLSAPRPLRSTSASLNSTDGGISRRVGTAGRRTRLTSHTGTSGTRSPSLRRTVSAGAETVAEAEVEAAKQQVGKGAAEGIEEFSDDDDEERRELVHRECWAPVAAAAGSLLSDAIEEWD